MEDYREILEFWFGKPEEEEYGKSRQFWFTKSSDFDQQVKSRFLETYQKAAAGKLNYWQKSPISCLALIILLDQFPRNMFRNQAQAFATDDMALQFSQYAISQGFDWELIPVQRWFLYLPFAHSENLEHQHQSVALSSRLKDDPSSVDTIAYALRHLQVIERFGRFPHRNKILGRLNTPEEEEFLQQPGSSF